jgi:hypothetical protein
MTMSAGGRRSAIGAAAWLLPALLFAAYVLYSYPMMYPGLDVYIHLVRIDAGSNGRWALFWHRLFELLQIDQALLRALMIHRVQTALTGVLLYLTAAWLLRLVFSSLRVDTALIRLGAWYSVLIWLLMHGTVSRPINGSTRIWQAWLQWYSVNYQIALPLALFAVAALLYGLLAAGLRRAQRAAYLAAAATAAGTTALIHAAEVPYVLFALLLAGLLFYRRAWRRWYLAAAAAALLLLLLGLTQSYRLPHGFVVLQRDGFAALIAEWAAAGRQLTDGLNRGNAGWNLWFWVTTAMALAALRLLWPQLSSLPRRVLLLVLLSALPAAGLYHAWTAGLPALVTYPRLAWRFVFASLLFVAPALLLIAVVQHDRPRRAPLVLSGLFGLLLAAVLLVSYVYEPNRVSFRYARSLLFALDPQAMYFRLPPAEAAWLADLEARLAAQPPQQPLCTDTFTAYRLYFERGYPAVALPERLTDDMRPPLPPTDCRFPRDGGPVLQQLGVAPPPWGQ